MAMTTGQFQLREKVREDLLRTLRITMRERPRRQDLVDGELAWEGYERRQIHEAVNRWRNQLGLPPVPANQIQNLESTAAGHIDYAEKLALRCANLALGIDPHAGDG